MMLAVRRATLDDVDFIHVAHDAAHARAFVHPVPLDAVRAALEDPARGTFILTKDGERAGMLLLAYDPEAPWLVELRRIIVTKQHGGIGTFALQWLVSRCFNEIGADRIWLEVVESNTRARRLYERAGFKHEGTFRDGFRDEDGRYANLCVYGLLRRDLV
ncbi:MAG TPA: GNAT family protein [Candidatus Baltobacteraceae bacterium]|jgi:RimJ/RimL family protein N-acetyltransferase